MTRPPTLHPHLPPPRMCLLVAALLLLRTAVGEDGYQFTHSSQHVVDSSTNLVAYSPAEPLVRTGDRIWLMNLRHLPSEVCTVRFPVIPRVSQIDHCGRISASSLEQYRTEILGNRPTVIYVHGNRYNNEDAIERGLYVYRNTAKRVDHDIDWVIWSWPSERKGILGRDVRTKAERTDGQGLLLADFLRYHVENSIPTTLIGFSFGGRVITGSVHALAGGSLRGMRLPEPHYYGAGFDVGLIAAAVESNWLNVNGYHQFATQNINRLTVLYNRRDAILKRYWLIDRVRGQVALGYTGPTSFAPRYDGSELPVRSKDCSAIVGLQHDERDYYGTSCRGGVEMAGLIKDTIAGM